MNDTSAHMACKNVITLLISVEVDLSLSFAGMQKIGALCVFGISVHCWRAGFAAEIESWQSIVTGKTAVTVPGFGRHFDFKWESWQSFEGFCLKCFLGHSWRKMLDDAFISSWWHDISKLCTLPIRHCRFREPVASLRLLIFKSTGLEVLQVSNQWGGLSFRQVAGRKSSHQRWKDFIPPKLHALPLRGERASIRIYHKTEICFVWWFLCILTFRWGEKQVNRSMNIDKQYIYVHNYKHVCVFQTIVLMNESICP